MQAVETKSITKPTRNLELERKLHRMTLIVGLVGIDGVVLAADREMRIPVENPEALDEVSTMRKIFHLPKHKVAYAVAGDDVTVDLGEDLAAALESKQFDLEHIKESLIKLSTDGQRKYANRPLLSTPRAMLLVFPNPQTHEPELWSWHFWTHQHSHIDTPDKRIAGAIGNSARFIMDAYFAQDMPVQKLKRLAAHIILSGHKADRYINGLDVATITRDGYQLMTPQEREAMREKSRAIDKLIFEA